MENMMKELTRYRLKVERDGKTVVDIPGIVCLPGLIAAPRMSIAGLVAAPLLGCNIHLETEDGKKVDIEKAVRETAETVIDSASTAAKTVKEEIEKFWESVSADDQSEADDAEAREDNAAPGAEEAQEDAAAEDAAEDNAESAEEQDTDEIPTIHVNPDDSQA